MANQQLTDYVKGQMVAGVSEPDVRKVLKEAGWPDADIEDSIKNAKPTSTPVISAVTAQTMGTGSASAFGTQVSKPVEPVKVESKKESMNFDLMSGSSGMAKIGGASADSKEPASKSFVPDTILNTGSQPKSGSRLPWIIAGVAVLALVGSVVYFMSKTGTASTLADQLTASNVALSAEIAELKNSGTSGASDLAAVKASAKSAMDELSLFIIPQNSSGTPSASQFVLKGLVAQVKGVYTLTTANGLNLSVKNSKDAKADFTLKPLIGATAELGGAHVPGSYEITVQMVNGSELQSPPISLPVQSTSTATSTR